MDRDSRKLAPGSLREDCSRELIKDRKENSHYRWQEHISFLKSFPITSQFIIGKNHETICSQPVTRRLVCCSRSICTGAGKERTATQTGRVSHGIAQTRSEIQCLGNVERLAIGTYRERDVVTRIRQGCHCGSAWGQWRHRRYFRPTREIGRGGTRLGRE